MRELILKSKIETVILGLPAVLPVEWPRIHKLPQGSRLYCWGGS